VAIAAWPFAASATVVASTGAAVFALWIKWQKKGHVVNPCVDTILLQYSIRFLGKAAIPFTNAYINVLGSYNAVKEASHFNFTSFCLFQPTVQHDGGVAPALSGGTAN
jgi:hypothetical protein